MANAGLANVVYHLRNALGPTSESDRDLLARFAAQGDAVAFTELVARHGLMVLGVCRRVLRHEQGAEDAFQATFLVLARKAGSVRWDKTAAPWLHEVATRTALRARSTIIRRRPRELEGRGGHLALLPAGDGHRHLRRAAAGLAGDPLGVVESVPSAALLERHAHQERGLPWRSSREADLGHRVDVLGHIVVADESERPFAKTVVPITTVSLVPAGPRRKTGQPYSHLGWKPKVSGPLKCSTGASAGLPGFLSSSALDCLSSSAVGTNFRL